MKYLLKYWVDAEHTIQAEKIEETDATKDQLLGHAHVISAEEIIEAEVVEEKKEEVKPVKKNKK